jgi:hypothetical protein
MDYEVFLLSGSASGPTSPPRVGGLQRIGGVVSLVLIRMAGIFFAPIPRPLPAAGSRRR